MPGLDAVNPAGGTSTTGLERRFIIFTCRDVRTDFRWPLAEALRARHETWYIWLKRQPRMLRPEPDAAMEDISFPSLLAMLMRMTRTKTANVYLNSTNTSFPLVILLLRLLCKRGLWIMDMHDDLLYHLTGLQRAQAALAIELQVRAADLVIRSAESLAELFPASLPFGNASQIKPIIRGAPDYRAVLVLASLDTRFDFAFMSAAAEACPNRSFDIYGQIARDDTGVAAKVAALCESHGNIVYHGSYILADLEAILSRYSVMLAPYCINTRPTRYLDPLRYYHCLNSGMELITTQIPQAERLQPALHVVSTPGDVEPILKNLECRVDAKRNVAENYHPQTWEQRAELLIRLAAA